MPSIDRADDDLKLLFQHLSAVVDTNKVMLVGARCRDILHRRYSAVPPQRKTDSAGVWGFSIIGLRALQDKLPRVSRDEPVLPALAGAFTQASISEICSQNYSCSTLIEVSPAFSRGAKVSNSMRHTLHALVHADGRAPQKSPHFCMYGRVCGVVKTERA